MKKILLIGGGGHCQSCIDVIEDEGTFYIEGIILDKLKNSKALNGYPILGDESSLSKYMKKTKNILIAVGQIKNFNIRKKIFTKLKNLGANFPIIKSSRAYLSKYSRLGEGTILMHGSIVNSNSQIGSNCIINTNALIEHGSLIGDHCHISTGAIINGEVTVGSGSFIGSGAIIRQNVKIGKNVIIGFGKRIMEDIPDNALIK